MLRNANIEADFEIKENKLKADTFKKQIATNSASVGVDNRQLVSIEKGTEKYLTQGAQLMAAEISISDLRIQKLKNQRDLDMIKIKFEYYDLIQETLQKSNNSKDFIFSLKKALDSVFANKDKK